jgi:Rod binding domain-containing protein
MDIHLMPGAVVAAAGANPKKVSPAEQAEGTFHQALDQAVAKPAAAKPAAKPDQVSEAATQFEALIIGQVLKAARASSDKGWLGTGDDQTGDMAIEMAEQGLAQGLAAQGGLGIAKMVTAKLRRDQATAANSAPSTESPQIHTSKDSAHHQTLTRQH